ncbi:MAG TPA: hypothetical protein VKW08_18960 [Xanthobacteraceae bacterium]|nr:hypothetical protein [Xanthobacteraceae bacterium]
MSFESLIGNQAARISVLALTAVLAAFGARAQVEIQGKRYPDWHGQWSVAAPRLPGQQLRFDPSKPFGKGQEAPLTDEYKKIYEANLAEIAKGGQGLFLYHASCLPGGMPAIMSAGQFEFIISPETTWIIQDNEDVRHIFTDGRPWPEGTDPTYSGISIGHWVDEAGTGAYDVLEVETRGPFKGPRVYDASGLPLDFDNESTFKERFFTDKKDPNILHDVITVFDHALTRPWTADKAFRRSSAKFPVFDRGTCLEGNTYVTIGKEYYMVTTDGYLMPTMKGQRPPDPKYFENQK